MHRANSLEKDPDAGNDWGQEEKGATEDAMSGCHHWLNGHEFEQTQGGGEGQRSLARCSSRGHEESDTIRDWTTMTNSWFTMFQVCRKWFNYIYLLYINIIVGICSSQASNLSLPSICPLVTISLFSFSVKNDVADFDWRRKIFNLVFGFGDRKSVV